MRFCVYMMRASMCACYFPKCCNRQINFEMCSQETRWEWLPVCITRLQFSLVLFVKSELCFLKENELIVSDRFQWNLCKILAFAITHTWYMNFMMLAMPHSLSEPLVLHLYSRIMIRVLIAAPVFYMERLRAAVWLWGGGEGIRNLLWNGISIISSLFILKL